MWYSDPRTDNSVIISSRIRLARNLKKYPFYMKLNPIDSERLINEVVGAVIGDKSRQDGFIRNIPLEDKRDYELRSLMEKHMVSPEFIKNTKPKGLLTSKDEHISIMINEEDHVRIQTIYPIDQMNDAWETADKIDNLLEESVEFAFDKDFGYLTSCPTNTGTGLRASFMVHIPMLEKSGQLKNLIHAISKFGMTVRGLYGEGTESAGSIYQISNQVTMGKSEQEIIAGLKNVTSQIIEKENALRSKVFSEENSDVVDNIYRSYGIITHARKLSGKEAVNLLSDIRLGFMADVLNLKKPSMSFYNLIMNIQPGNLIVSQGQMLSDTERDYIRAEYLRNAFKC